MPYRAYGCLAVVTTVVCVHRFDVTPMHTALGAGKPDMVKLLLVSYVHQHAFKQSSLIETCTAVAVLCYATNQCCTHCDTYCCVLLKYK
jgi:hypothetical protein